jgi:hypothetical protein
MVAGFVMFSEVEDTEGDPVLDIGGVGGEAYCTVVDVVCDCSGVCNIVKSEATNEREMSCSGAEAWVRR